MKNYYKIGEISKIYDIGRDSLMYYEKIGILNPFRDNNGYRMYSIRDIWKLNVIKELRNLNFPMKKIKEYLDNRSIDFTKNILIEEISLLEKKILELKTLEKNIKKRLEAINSVVSNSNLYKIQLQFMNERKALKLNGDIHRDEEIDFLLKKLQRKYEHKFYVLGNNNLGAIYSMDKINQNIFNHFKAVFCLLEDEDPDYNLTLKEGYYVTFSYGGPYKKNHVYITKLLEFIKDNNYKILDNPIEIYKIDVHETSLEEEFITEIQIPIEINN